MRPREQPLNQEQDHQTAFGICPTCNVRQIIHFSIGPRAELIESLGCGCGEETDGSVCHTDGSQLPKLRLKIQRRNGDPRAPKPSDHPRLCPICRTRRMTAKARYSCAGCRQTVLRRRAGCSVTNPSTEDRET